MRTIISATSLLLIFTTSAALAEVEKEKTLKRSSVGDQEIQIEYFYHIARDCQSLGEIRIAIVSPPKNGTITPKTIEVNPTYKQDNPRYHCNKELTKALAVTYKANPGFRGTEKFRYAFVFYDGTATFRTVEMTVWGN